MNQQVPVLFEEAVKAMAIYGESVFVLVSPNALAECVTLRCNPADAPRLVGKSGRGINAIARLARHLFQHEGRVADMTGKMGPAIQDDGSDDRGNKRRPHDPALIVDVLARLVRSCSEFGGEMDWCYAVSQDKEYLCIWMLTGRSRKEDEPLMKADLSKAIQTWLTIAASAQGMEVILGEAKTIEEAGRNLAGPRRTRAWGDVCLLGAKPQPCWSPAPR
jgi:predicted RNA-binding protein YlqC (UPF0109 family)